MDINDVIQKLNRKKIFLIVVVLTAYTYTMIGWLYPMMNEKNTTMNIAGGLISVVLLLLMTYVIPKIINFKTKK